MRRLTAFMLALALAAPAFAQNATCSATAAEKKLAGAAKTSFLKKCEKDAVSACATTAADKKLAGAAKQSYERKCVSDAVGAASDGTASGVSDSPKK